MTGVLTIILSKSITTEIITATSVLKAQELIEGSFLSIYEGSLNFKLDKVINNLIIGENGIKLDLVCLVKQSALLNSQFQNQHRSISKREIVKSQKTKSLKSKTEIVKNLFASSFMFYLLSNNLKDNFLFKKTDSCIIYKGNLVLNLGNYEWIITSKGSKGGILSYNTSYKKNKIYTVIELKEEKIIN